MDNKVYILQQRTKESYMDSDIHRIYGVFTSPENAFAALDSFLEGIEPTPLSWAEYGRENAGAELWYTKVAGLNMFLVGIPLDFGVPVKESSND